MTPNVFAIIDDIAVRESTTNSLRARSVNFQVYASSEGFLANYNGRLEGCLLIDTYVPQSSGIDLMKRLMRDGVELPVIMGTAERDVHFAVAAMRGGAVTCLERPYDEQVLWLSIVEAMELSKLSGERSRYRFEALRRLALLTIDEQRVLDELMLGKCNKSIAASLDLGLRTVELRRSRILQKMRAQSLSELVQTVMVANGPAAYRFGDEGPAPIVLDSSPGPISSSAIFN
jgi:FixJ family two-component response regulator